MAALSTPAGSALATAKSVNAGTAAAMIVSTGTPAIAGSGPMTINQTLSSTANTIIGGAYSGGQYEARHTSEPMAQRDDANHHENNDHRVSMDHVQGRLENGDHLLGHDHQPANSEGKDRHHPALAAPDRQQNSVTGLGIEAANGTGPVQATANGAGAGTALATGPRASSAGAAGQSATVAATNVADRATPSATVQAVNVTMNAGVALVPDDRREKSTIHEMSIRDNLLLAVHGRPQKQRSKKSEEKIVSDWVSKFKIKMSNPYAPISSLSGGNQQKAVIARCLETKPQVLILVEATRGIDLGAKAEIYQILRELAAEGLAILVVSSELSEIFEISDRVLVMHAGDLTADLDRSNIEESDVVSAATGAKNEQFN